MDLTALLDIVIYVAVIGIITLVIGIPAILFVDWAKKKWGLD